MALPKRRHYKARSKKRRANWKVAAPNIVACHNCHEPKLAHHVCPSCGYYKNEKVIEVSP